MLKPEVCLNEWEWLVLLINRELVRGCSSKTGEEDRGGKRGTFRVSENSGVYDYLKPQTPNPAFLFHFSRYEDEINKRTAAENEFVTLKKVRAVPEIPGACRHRLPAGLKKSPSFTATELPSTSSWNKMPEARGILVWRDPQRSPFIFSF